MFKRLSVKEVSSEQREFAERTANIDPCRLNCRESCLGPGELVVEDWIAIGVYMTNVGECFPG